VIGHQQIAKQLHLMDRERFRENLLEGDIVLLFLEDFSSEVSAIEGVIKPARFVSSGRSWHARSLSNLDHQLQRGLTPLICPQTGRAFREGDGKGEFDYFSGGRTAPTGTPFTSLNSPALLCASLSFCRSDLPSLSNVAVQF
jgi:hypothetical protein